MTPKQSQPLDELKRCPFCGEKPEALEITGQEDKYPIERYWVRCTCEVEQVGLFTRAGAIKAWNTRTPSTPPQSDNHGELLKEIISRFYNIWNTSSDDNTKRLALAGREFAHNALTAQPEHIVDSHEMVQPDYKGIAEKLAEALRILRNNIGVASLVKNPYGIEYREQADKALTEYRALTESKRGGEHGDQLQSQSTQGD